MRERLQKVIAAAGVASRRRAEELIRRGQVRVNGLVVTEMGVRVDPQADRVEVDGRPLQREVPVYVLLYKPTGYVSTLRDPQGRPLVVDLLRGVPQRVFPVGRLDYDTEGLLLLTNDGELAHRLAHPRYGVEKTYLARVRGVPDARDVERLRRGVELEEGPTAPAVVRVLETRGQSALLELRLREGRNREVRRMCAAVGHPVQHLLRARLAFLTLRGLSPGQYRFLTPAEVRRLRELVALPPAGPAPRAGLNPGERRRISRKEPTSGGN